MKDGDRVMFVGRGRYAKWFFGQLGTVVHYTYHPDGRSSCRVRWLNPIKYHDRFTSVSDFRADQFEIAK